MKRKISWRDALIFAQISQRWLKSHPEKTKLAYAIGRVTAQLGALESKSQETLEAIDLEHCAVDERQLVIGSSGSYRFEKDELKLRNKKRTEFFDKKEFEIDPFFTSIVPNDLTVEELEGFRGFVISSEKVEEIFANREAEFAEDDVSVSTNGKAEQIERF